MQVVTFAFEFKNYTRAFSLPDFATKSKHQRFDIGKHNTTPGWASKDTFQRATMPGFHVIQSNNVS